MRLLFTICINLHYFLKALACTASVLIMVLIALERYLAIMHAITAKRVLRTSNLRIAVTCVWTLSIAICSPRLWMFALVEVPTGRPDGQIECICILQQLIYNQKLYHLISFGILFAIPLAITSFVYSTLGLRLYASDIQDVMRLTRIHRKEHFSSLTPSAVDSTAPTHSNHKTWTYDGQSSSSNENYKATCCRLGKRPSRMVRPNGHSTNCPRAKGNSKKRAFR